MNQLFESNPNVLLMQQSCGQRSGIASGSKLERRALTYYFPVISYYMLPLFKYRGGWDVGLWVTVTSGLAKRMPLRIGEFWRILLPNTFPNRKSALCIGIFFASPQIMHRFRSDYLLHFDTWNIWQIRTGKWNASTRRLPPAARALAGGLPRQDHVWITTDICFVSTTTNSMKCLDWWLLLTVI